MREGGTLHYLYGDHLGSMSLTLDVNGNVVAQRRYDPYGQGRWSRGEEQTDFGFNSHREESEFGLYDYKARYFSPLLGRFISADSIVPDFSNPQDLNRYSYVRNNPLKYTDPSGHICVPCIIAVAAISWLSMDMAIGDQAPPHDPTEMYLKGADTALKVGGDTAGDIYALTSEYPNNVGINAAAVAIPIVSGGMIKSVQALFRGTSEGWAGSRAMQAVGITPASSDPLVATLFGLESASKGDGVLHVALPGDLDNIVVQPGSRGSLSTLEKEFEVGVNASEFSSRSRVTISVDQARDILENMGFSLPTSISGIDNLDYYINNTPRLTEDQIDEFIRQAIELTQ